MPNRTNQLPINTAIWIPNPYASRYELGMYGDTMQSLNDLLMQLLNTQLDYRRIRNIARSISVHSRKLLEDGLLTRAIHRPKLHNLAEVPNPEPLTLTIDGTIAYKPSPNASNLWEIPVKNTFTLNSLPGYKHTGFSRWQPYTSIFAINTQPTLKMKDWLKKRLLTTIINNEPTTLTLRDAIYYVADTEGAHADNYTNPRSQKAEKAKLLEIIGGQETLIYPHWLAICVGLYLCNYHVCGLNRNYSEWQHLIDDDVIPSLQNYIQIDIDGEISHNFQIPTYPLGINLDNITEVPQEPHPTESEVKTATTSE